VLNLEDILLNAQSLVKNGNFKGAISILKNSLSAESTNEEKIIIRNAIAYVLTKKGDNDEAIELLEKNLQKSIKLSFEKGEAETLFYLSRTYAIKGDPEMGKEMLKRLEDRFTGLITKTPLYSARITLLRTIISTLEGDYDTAITNGEECSQLLADMDRHDELVDSLNYTARAYLRRGDFAEALSTYGRLLTVAMNSSDLTALRTCYNNMGVIYRTQGNYILALENFKKTLEFYESVGDLYGIGIVCINIGKTLKSMGELETALNNLLRAEKIFTDINHYRGLALTYGEIAGIYHAINDHVKSIDYYKKTVEYYDKTGLVELYSEHMSNFIDLLLDIRRIGDTSAILSNLQAQAMKSGSKLDSAYHSYQAANIELAKGNLGLARERFIELLDFTEKAKFFTISIKIKLNLARIYFESYTLNNDQEDLDKAKYFVSRVVKLSLREKLYPHAINALMAQAMFQVTDIRFEDGIKILESALLLSKEKKLSHYAIRIQELLDQLTHRKRILEGFDGKKVSSFTDMARTETKLLMKTALGKREEIEENIVLDWCSRSFIVVFYLSPVGPEEFYSDNLPIRKFSSQETTKGQLGMYVSFALQQGVDESVPEGLYGPLPAADIEGYISYIFSTRQPKDKDKPLVVCFIIPKESIEVFFNRETLITRFKNYLQDIRDIKHENSFILKKKLFGLETD